MLFGRHQVVGNARISAAGGKLSSPAAALVCADGHVFGGEGYGVVFASPLQPLSLASQAGSALKSTTLCKREFLSAKSGYRFAKIKNGQADIFCKTKGSCCLCVFLSFPSLFKGYVPSLSVQVATCVLKKISLPNNQTRKPRVIVFLPLPVQRE